MRTFAVCGPFLGLQPSLGGGGLYFHRDLEDFGICGLSISIALPPNTPEELC